MTSQLRRRDALMLLGAGAAAWPLPAHAQPKVPVIGYLNVSGPDQGSHFAFVKGLAETGLIEGKNVAIEYRWAYGKHELLPAIAAELVGRRVDLIAASGASSAVRAAKAATTTIPIVFWIGDTDPVQAGIVASLNRPGDNITGASLMGGSLGVKRVGLLSDLLPKATSFAVLANPGNPASAPDRQEVEAAARERGLRPIMIGASEPGEFEAAFASMAQQKADALIVTADPFFTVHLKQVTALAAKHAIPAIYQWRFFAEAGGLMSYGTHIPEVARQMGVYAGRILKGAKPGELPVLLPTKFEFVINLKTAKALGLTFPPGLLAIADEVIE